MSNPLDFSGKLVFVAGGTSGINLGIAKRYAELGAKVAVAGRNPEKAQAAAAEIGKGALGLSCDVRDYAAIRGGLEQATAKLGPLDIVVSGAAGNSSRLRSGCRRTGFAPWSTSTSTAPSTCSAPVTISSSGPAPR